MNDPIDDGADERADDGVEGLLAQAQAQHRAGRFAEAESAYRALLQARPDHAEALHGLGCLAQAAGRPDIAIGLIGQAVAHAPEVVAYGVSLGLALLERGHGEEARAALHVAVLRAPRMVEAHRAHAQALLRLGRLGEAEAALRQAIALAPRDVAAHLVLGRVLQAAGRSDEALAWLRQASELDPWAPLAWHALASAHAVRGEGQAAEVAFRKVSGLLPNDAAAAANLGTALWGLGRHEEAETELERSLRLAPAAPASLSSLGLVLLAEARPLAAEVRLREARRLAPEDPAILVNHASALAALERDAEAAAALDDVLARDPDHAEARFNRATLDLAHGRRAEGWRGFEARLRLAGGGGIGVAGRLPQWDGAPRRDGSVLIRAEQGLGDGLMFLRWLPSAASRAALVLLVPPALLRLVQQSDLPVRCVAAGEELADDEASGCVAEASLLSLPALLDLPDPPPPAALRVDPDEAHAWEALLPARLGRLRVGLVWAGATGYRFDRARSLSLARLAPLSRASGVLFVSLQQGEAGEAAAPDGMTLWRPHPQPADLAATAALISCLDLVIGVDTALVHLAGSLGVPVWLLDRFGGDWRWRAGFGADWYPWLRRFAQDRASDSAEAWDGVVEAVAVRLAGRGRGVLS